jgi:RNA polymerase sigma-70 factor, ECF subfamily
MRVPLDQAQASEMSPGETLGLLDEGLLVRPEQSEEVIGVHKAMENLAKIAPRQAQVVQLQFFGGLTQEEIAAVLEVSVETVKLDWRKAKGYLQLCLGQDK